ncbi:MAG TPA: hypothetical protein VJS69_13875 [Candidatus Krumholzibacteria bacterium]|nr:hypothetical protein [Candidatus Krumholzibacteria bacterium]
MKTLATGLLLLALAVPAAAGTVWDEGTDGDLATDPATPTPITFATGTNTIIGTVTGTPVDRDYITFTIAPGTVLAHLNLITWDPDDFGFMAFNAGATGLVPSGATNASFLSGIHLNGADVGQDLMVFFATRKVTTNGLPQPQLGPGTYTWIVQQLGPFIESYQVDFVIEVANPTEPSTWGRVKALYR